MGNTLFTPSSTVMQVFNEIKEASQAFIQHRTACVGCLLTNFCTLRDVTITYGLSLDDFLRELQSIAQASYPTFTGVQNEKQV